jgi:hypothetical protein
VIAVGGAGIVGGGVALAAGGSQSSSEPAPTTTVPPVTLPPAVTTTTTTTTTQPAVSFNPVMDVFKGSTLVEATRSPSRALTRLRHVPVDRSLPLRYRVVVDGVQRWTGATPP